MVILNISWYFNRETNKDSVVSYWGNEGHSALFAADTLIVIARAERDGTRAETRFRLSPKRTSPFKSVGESVQSTAGSRGVSITSSNAGYTTFGSGVRVLATHSILQFPLYFPSRASPCATRFRTTSTSQLITSVLPRTLYINITHSQGGEEYPTCNKRRKSQDWSHLA